MSGVRSAKGPPTCCGWSSTQPRSISKARSKASGELQTARLEVASWASALILVRRTPDEVPNENCACLACDLSLDESARTRCARRRVGTRLRHHVRCRKERGATRWQAIASALDRSRGRTALSDQ